MEHFLGYFDLANIVQPWENICLKILNFAKKAWFLRSIIVQIILH